jgi:hypothetical protein
MRVLPLTEHPPDVGGRHRRRGALMPAADDSVATDEGRHRQGGGVGEATVPAGVDPAGLAADDEDAVVLDDTARVAAGLEVALGDETAGAGLLEGLVPAG